MKLSSKMTRRVFVLGSSALLLGGLAGCASLGEPTSAEENDKASEDASGTDSTSSTSTNESTNEVSSDNTSDTNSSGNPSESDTTSAEPASPEENAANSSTQGSDTILVYFSRAGENYTNDDIVMLDVGNTAVVADFIAEALGCVTYEIEPETPYPVSYDEMLQIAQTEQDENARPAIRGYLPDLTPYANVIIGSPIWWGKEPMIMRTFLDGVDTAGKHIYPFTTSGGSGLGSVVSDYEELCPNAEVDPNGFTVLGVDAKESEPEVDAWLEEIGLL